jgi:hypothetical protein
MNTYSLYRIADGLFTGKQFSGASSGAFDGMLPLHTDCSFILGEYDPMTQRVDLATGNVVDYIPPRPSLRYEWDIVTRRWVYVAGEAEALWFAQDAAMRQVNAFYASRLSDIRATYPPDEVTSWAKQEGEARAWTADNAAPTPLLSAITTARGVPFALLVEKVIEKADLFAAESGRLIGARQQAEDRINAATTPAEVEAIIAQLFPSP